MKTLGIALVAVITAFTAAPSVADDGEFQILSGPGRVAVPDWRNWDCTPVWVDDSGSFIREECVGGMDRFRTPAGEVFMVGWGYNYNDPDPTKDVHFALRLDPDHDAWYVGEKGKRFKVVLNPSRSVIEFSLAGRNSTGFMSPVRQIPLNPGNPHCPVFPGE